MTRRTVNPFYATRIDRSCWRRPIGRINVLDLFSGIGGFALGFERAGMHTAAFCEIDPFCQRVLKRHWPEKPIYHDIKQLTQRRLHHDRIQHIDLICGGYPCQPFSVAGHRRGEEDPRHLWPEMHRLIREIKPRWVVCENVDGHVELGLDNVLTDLESQGYSCWPFIIPACAIGAPHRRDRVWIIAHSCGIRRVTPPSTLPIPQDLSNATVFGELPTPFTSRINDGIPFLVDRIRALGNAVVPLIPELIGRAIIAYERDSEAEPSKFRIASTAPGLSARNVLSGSLCSGVAS